MLRGRKENDLNTVSQSVTATLVPLLPPADVQRGTSETTQRNRAEQGRRQQLLKNLNKIFQTVSEINRSTGCVKRINQRLSLKNLTKEDEKNTQIRNKKEGIIVYMSFKPSKTDHFL